MCLHVYTSFVQQHHMGCVLHTTESHCYHTITCDWVTVLWKHKAVVSYKCIAVIFHKPEKMHAPDISTPGCCFPQRCRIIKFANFGQRLQLSSKEHTQTVTASVAGFLHGSHPSICSQQHNILWLPSTVDVQEPLQVWTYITIVNKLVNEGKRFRVIYIYSTPFASSLW